MTKYELKLTVFGEAHTFVGASLKSLKAQAKAVLEEGNTQEEQKALAFLKQRLFFRVGSDIECSLNQI